MKFICSLTMPFSFIFEIVPLGNCVFHLKHYSARTLAGQDEHFCTGHGQICSVCHRLGGVIKLYLSEL